MTEAAPSPEIPWPEEWAPLAEVSRWISAALPGHPAVGEPIQKLGGANGGFVARLTVSPPSSEAAVVFKTNRLPQFRGSARLASVSSGYCPGDVPHVLAWRELPHRADTVFRLFEGEPICSIRSMEALCEMGRTLARVQSQAADLSGEETAGLPRLPLTQVPRLLDGLIADIKARYWTCFEAEDGALRERFDIPTERCGGVSETAKRPQNPPLPAVRPHPAAPSPVSLALSVSCFYDTHSPTTRPF